MSSLCNPVPAADAFKETGPKVSGSSRSEPTLNSSAMISAFHRLLFESGPALELNCAFAFKLPILVVTADEAEKFLAAPLKFPLILIEAGRTMCFGINESTIRAWISSRPEENRRRFISNCAVAASGSPWIEPVRSTVVESPAAIRNSSIRKSPIRPESWEENPIDAPGLFFIGRDGTKKSKSEIAR